MWAYSYLFHHDDEINNCFKKVNDDVIQGGDPARASAAFCTRFWQPLLLLTVLTVTAAVLYLKTAGFTFTILRKIFVKAVYYVTLAHKKTVFIANEVATFFFKFRVHHHNGTTIYTPRTRIPCDHVPILYTGRPRVYFIFLSKHFRPGENRTFDRPFYYLYI